jgi:hypothetical protein
MSGLKRFQGDLFGFVFRCEGPYLLDLRNLLLTVLGLCLLGLSTLVFCRLGVRLIIPVALSLRLILQAALSQLLRR